MLCLLLVARSYGAPVTRFQAEGDCYELASKYLATRNIAYVISDDMRGRHVQAIMSLVSLVISVIMVYLNFNTIKDLLFGIREDSSTWLDKIVNLFSQYPTFNSLIADMDTQMTSLSGSYFSPAVTFTSILQTFGIGDAVNTIITCALQGIAFVISIRLMMWSFSRIRLSITKPLG